MTRQWTQPVRYTGSYSGYWAGYKFKEALGYTSGRHTGVDYNFGSYNEDLGFSVNAIAEGVVVYVGDQTSIGFGKTVIIRHTLTDKQRKESGAKKYAYSRYLHLDSYRVKKGQKVKMGTWIGVLGRTGTRWAHLHLDLWTDKNGLGSHLQYHKDTQLDSYLDPFKWIQAHRKLEPLPPAPKPEPVPEPAPEPKPEPQPEPEPTPPEVQPEPKLPAPAPPRPVEPTIWDRLWDLIQRIMSLWRTIWQK